MREAVDIAAALTQADDLLYQVKRAGRKGFAVETFKAKSEKVNG
jgi:PleD family two-component response regulator